MHKLFSKVETDNHYIYKMLFFKVKLKKYITNRDLTNKIDFLLTVQNKQVDLLLNNISSIKYDLLSKIEPIPQKPFLPFISIHLVDKCNNNCESCSHFCTLADNFILDLRDYERDLAILTSKFQIGEMDLMGGEPLLHPQIVEVFDLTRKYLPNTHICLHTNALLLPKMSEEFWSACKRNNICFKITKYPNCEDFNQIIDLCLSNDVYVNGIINGNEFLHWMDRSGNGNIEDNFNACKFKFGCCYIMRNSRLYTCPTACYMDYYNKYFDKNLPVEKGIDIFNSTPDDILTYLRTPLENCKYCKNVNNLKRTPWKRSERKVEEWET